jgi:hypothetical protein
MKSLRRQLYYPHHPSAAAGWVLPLSQTIYQIKGIATIATFTTIAAPIFEVISSRQILESVRLELL